MNKQKLFSYIPLILCLILGFLVFSLRLQKESEKSRRIQKELELSTKIGELTLAQAALGDLEKKNAQTAAELGEKIEVLEKAIKSYEENAAALSTNIESLTQEKEELSKELLAKDRTIAELSKKIQALEMDKRDLLDAAKKIQDETSVGTEEGFFGQTPTSSGATSPVQLGQILVQKSSGNAAKVQHVDALYRFIVINAGSKDGLKREAVVHIVRDKKLVGRAVLKKVRERISSAVLLPEYSPSEIQPGDLISLA